MPSNIERIYSGMANNNLVSISVNTGALGGHLHEISSITLNLFCSIDMGYHDFQLMQGNEKLGGKFDDIVFRYRKVEGGPWACRFIQSKHKANPKQQTINGKRLLEDKKGDFSLAKYF